MMGDLAEGVGPNTLEEARLREARRRAQPIGAAFDPRLSTIGYNFDLPGAEARSIPPTVSERTGGRVADMLYDVTGSNKIAGAGGTAAEMLVSANPFVSGGDAAVQYGRGEYLPGTISAAGAVIPAAKPGAQLLKGAARRIGGAIGDVAEQAQYANPKLRAKAEALFGKYPQYAEEYPQIGPPELMSKVPDGKGGFLAKADKAVPYKTMKEALRKDAEPGFFLEKKLLPEVEQFAKDRATIQKEMDLHGYEPYFDPAKRFDVNPKHYGPFADTAVEAAPKTAKTQAEWSAKYGSEEARARLQQAYQEGLTVPHSDRWYLMGQLEKEYIKELGAQEGRAAFKREFGDMMAATTGGASPYNNLLMAQYAGYMAKRAERMPERSYNLPFPIGGRYAAGNIKQAQKYIDEGMTGFDPAVNSKRYDFSSAFTGNKNAATIDEQMTGAIHPGEQQPQWYGPATQTVREEAAKVGVEPRDYQGIDWAGLKKQKEEAKGKTFEYEGPMINHVNRSIETTSRLTGMPREEVVRRGLIRKEIPMYGLLGAAAVPVLGGAFAQDQY